MDEPLKLYKWSPKTEKKLYIPVTMTRFSWPSTRAFNTAWKAHTMARAKALWVKSVPSSTMTQIFVVLTSPWPTRTGNDLTTALIAVYLWLYDFIFAKHEGYHLTKKQTCCIARLKVYDNKNRHTVPGVENVTVDTWRRESFSYGTQQQQQQLRYRLWFISMFRLQFQPLPII